MMARLVFHQNASRRWQFRSCLNLACKFRLTIRRIVCSSRERRISAIDPGDPEDIRCPGGSKWHPSGNNDPLADLGDVLAVRDSYRLLHHVAKVLDVARVHAMRAPQHRETARRSEVRRQDQDRSLRSLT